MNIDMRFNVAGVLLAAGESRRFKSNKLLHPLLGKPIISYSFRTFLESPLDDFYIVVGRKKEEILNIMKAYMKDRKVTVIVNEFPLRGIISSLKEALGKVGSNYDGVIVFLADMPFITKSIVLRLLQEFKRCGSKKMIVPVCENKLYHPRIIPRRLFPLFLRLKDSERGTKIMKIHPEEVIKVRVGEPFNFLDIDTPEDLKRIESEIGQ